jgi:aminopeptidase N
MAFSSKEIPYDANIDVISYHLQLDLVANFKPSAKKSFMGFEEIKFILKGNPKQNKVWFHASSKSIVLKSVVNKNIKFNQSDNKIYFDIGSIYKINDTISLSFYYNHLDVKDEAFFVSEGSVFTNNAPIEGRDWFICKDHPSDKALFSIRTIVPKNVIVGSVGLLQSSKDSAECKIYDWSSNIPMSTYLMVFSASTEYKIESFVVRSTISGREIPVELYWREKEDFESVTNIRKAIPYLLQFFEERFGEYPYEKIGFATLTSDFQYGGMENQTFITLCSSCWNEMLAVHEFAHQWFGDLVSFKSWKDIWLSEGFAEYSEALWIEKWSNYGAESYQNVMNEFASTYFTVLPEDAIIEESWDNNTPAGEILYNPALVYRKAACVLYMLRKEVGDKIFFKILKAYITNKNFKFGNASTDDFVLIVNTCTKQDYGWFFDQWLKYPGHPTYINKNRFYEEDGKNYFETTIIQKNWERIYYKSNIEFKIKYADGSSEVLKCFNKENGEIFKFEVRSGAETVEFDPENKIILKKED